jgi:hypothetical protein
MTLPSTSSISEPLAVPDGNSTPSEFVSGAFAQPYLHRILPDTAFARRVHECVMDEHLQHNIHKGDHSLLASDIQEFANNQDYNRFTVHHEEHN